MKEYSYNNNYNSGFATTHVLVSVRHPPIPLINLSIPYQLQKYVKNS